MTCVIIGLFLLLPLISRAELIDSFQSTIEVQSDGSFSVTEKIEYDFGNLDKHGMFRYVPTIHPEPTKHWYTERYMDIAVSEVLMNGAAVPYEVTEESARLFIKIGDPQTTVTGKHSYEITYDVVGGLSFYVNGGAELYWNVTGHDWGIPIRAAEVVLLDPDNILSGQRACYFGLPGETRTCHKGTDPDSNIIFRATFLSPGAEFTVANAINRVKVEEVVLERTKVLYFIIPALIIWFMVLISMVFRYRTEHKTGRTIVAQYEPYQDFKPMYTGLLFDGTLHPQDITACIVYLAEQGYLKIKKTKSKVLFFIEVDDYEIYVMKSLDSALTAFQQEVLKLLFGESPEKGNIVTLGKLKTNHSKQRENQKILKNLKKDLEKDLEANGFFQVTISKSIVIIIAIVVVAALFFLVETGIMWALTQSGEIVVVVAAIILSIVILLFMYRRRTRKGYEALDYLKGFKEFLSVTEKERYAFHNAPQKSPEQFMEYLPYAIAFGVEKEWAEVFESITIPDPEWYDGGSVGHFSAVNLTTSLGAFSTAFASSSGSSGSSGGGSAGGGAGGGGGGSW
ncbi:DUF2207 domain-containing protein [bacterium]|nr:DUF2207 domain-containing protein [bacterium]